MDDLISRQAAIDAMSETLKRVFPEHRQIAEKCLNALPSAQPEVRAQMSSADCISRQTVLKLLHALPPEEAITKAMLIQSVKQMDAAPPEQRWIPCSERLPEPNLSVLVQLNDGFVDPIQIMTLNISKSEGDFFCFWRTQEMGIDFDMDDVVAWMPLPEPWEGEQDDH